MEELIDSFEAVSDDGQTFSVLMYQRMTEHRPLSGPVQQIRGSKRLALSDGRAVNSIDDNTFRIVVGGIIIRKV